MFLTLLSSHESSPHCHITSQALYAQESSCPSTPPRTLFHSLRSLQSQYSPTRSLCSCTAESLYIPHTHHNHPLAPLTLSSNCFSSPNPFCYSNVCDTAHYHASPCSHCWQ